MDDERLRPRTKRHRPRVPHALTHQLVNTLGEYYQEHVRRNRADGSLSPGDTWQLVYGFLLAAHQTYEAVCLLLAHKRPRPFLLQAATLNRALFEYLANACALLQDTESRTPELLRDAYRTNALVYESRRARFADDEQWREYFETMAPALERDATRLQLSQDLIDRPKSIPRWPTPRRLITGPTAKVTGTVRHVLEELYESHYPIASAQAHGRGMATSMAIAVAHPEYQLEPDNASGYVTTAQVMLACLWTEVSVAARVETNPKLLEYWQYMRDYDAEAVDLWNLRYRELLAVV